MRTRLRLVLEGMSRRLQQSLCGARAHRYLLRRDPARLSLECLNCGHETVGWDVTPSRVLLERLARPPARVKPGARARRATGAGRPRIVARAS